jgi:hypothetical protein
MQVFKKNKLNVKNTLSFYEEEIIRAGMENK